MIQGPDFLDDLVLFEIITRSKRLSAKRALLHPYFDTLEKEALPAKPGEYQIKWSYPQTLSSQSKSNSSAVSIQPKSNTSAIPKANQVKK